jgi:hypothetical protein
VSGQLQGGEGGEGGGLLVGQLEGTDPERLLTEAGEVVEEEDAAAESVASLVEAGAEGGVRVGAEGPGLVFAGLVLGVLAVVEDELEAPGAVGRGRGVLQEGEAVTVADALEVGEGAPGARAGAFGGPVVGRADAVFGLVGVPADVSDFVALFFEVPGEDGGGRRGRRSGRWGSVRSVVGCWWRSRPPTRSRRW